MSKIVSFAEFTYFRTEREPFERLREGARMMLYVCLESEEFAKSRGNKSLENSDQARMYGKAMCSIRNVSMPPKEVRNELPTLINVQLEDEDVQSELLGVAGDLNNLVRVTHPVPGSLMRMSFPNMLVDYYLDAKTEVALTEGFFIDRDQIDPMLMQDQMATHGGDDDGLAGVRVPANPKSPLPAIALE